MYSLFIDYLSKLSNYLTSNLNTLKTIRHQVIHNPKFCLPYNLTLGSLKGDNYPFKTVRVLCITKKLHDYLLKYQSLSLLPKINHFIFGMLTACRSESCDLQDQKINCELQLAIDSLLADETTKILEMICLQVLDEETKDRVIADEQRQVFLTHTFIDSHRIKCIGFKNTEELLSGVSQQLRQQIELLYNADGILFQRFKRIISRCQDYGLTLLNLDKSISLIEKNKNKLILKENVMIGKVFIIGFDEPFRLNNTCEINDTYQLSYNTKTLGLQQCYSSISKRAVPIKMPL